MASKNPVSVLQEFCVKKHAVPYYDLIADGTDATKTFAYQVQALGYSADGEAKSKKDAKSEAAINIINILKAVEHFKNDFHNVPDYSAAKPANCEFDAVGILLNICVQRDMPIAQFNVQQACGQPHAPEFTVECRVASIARVGTYSTKKGAKQIAAQAMLDVLQKMPTTEPSNQIVSINSETPEKLLKTYRDLKKSDIKVHPGILLCDRHMYFKKLDNAQKEIFRHIYYDIPETHMEKVYMLCKALKWKFDISDVVDHPMGNIKIFELHENYDVVITGHEPKLYADILDYFHLMMGIRNDRNLYI